MEETAPVSDQSEPALSESTTETSATTTTDNVAYETYKRVLGEKKKMQANLSEVNDKLKVFEQNDLESKGKQSELINSLRKELEQTKASLTHKESSYAWNVVTGQIKTLAVQEGCKDPDTLIKLLDKKDLGTIEVDENFTANSEDIKRLIEQTKQTYSKVGLFGKTVATVADSTPGAHRPKKQTLADLSIEQKSKMLAKLL